MTSILIAAFDGLQPAQVRPDLMPNLAQFASDGVFFESHHPVFPSVTRINAASMVTGTYSGRHGLAANTMVARDYNPSASFSALEPTLADIARKTGRVLFAPTLADILSEQGMEYTAIGVGTSGNAYVHNPRADESGGATIHPEFTLPYDLSDRLHSRFGPWPDEAMPNTPRLDHAVRILTEHILPERQPAVALIWSSEPDKAQHAHGVGSEMSDRAIREADARFGSILDWLESNGRGSDTDVLVISDHGYSTIQEVVDVEWYTRDAGFTQEEVIVAPNGGSALFYCQEGAVTQRLAAWLMERPWCGALLASEAAGEIEGTLPMSLAGAEGPRAPELAMSFGWDSRPNDAGYSGFAYSSGGQPGQGQHGSMSRHEMNNTLIGRGPSFRSSTRVQSPTGNVDLAPTVLQLLGLPVPEHMEGRVLAEALAGGENSVDWTSTTHRAERKTSAGMYCQTVRVSTVDSTSYIDEGSGWLMS
ncbi:MAG: alkaline phosphatase family protein [Dehalococcoidia bacterium]|nr:alkaline phosphatase family protein [Dehalococcoidia bacterium]